MQAYLQCPIDRGPQLRERLSGPRHCGERVHGSVERRAAHRLAARGGTAYMAATAKTASSAALLRLPMCMPPAPKPRPASAPEPHHHKRLPAAHADQVVCHRLSRSLADSLAPFRSGLMQVKPISEHP